MKKITLKILNFIYNDWQVIHVFSGVWNIHVNDDFFGNYMDEKHCRCEIQLSKFENRHRVKCYGYKVFEHQQYINAVNFFNDHYNK